jgi:hypothetical protein
MTAFPAKGFAQSSALSTRPEAAGATEGHTCPLSKKHIFIAGPALYSGILGGRGSGAATEA